MPATDVLVNNGKMDVMVYELPPVAVTKDNAKEVFANDPGCKALLADGSLYLNVTLKRRKGNPSAA